MGNIRFQPGKFRYNGRVAVALIPSLIVLAGFGGKIPMGVTLVGAMLSYILDAMRFREGALGAVWITLGVVNLSLWLSGAIFASHRPILLSTLIAACCGTTLFTTGIWATLQFKWIQMQYPVVVLAFEKLLLATAFTVAAMVQSWGLLAAVGASHAPFFLAPVLCALYRLLALPLSTSFHVKGPRDSAIGGKRSRELQIQAPVEGFCAAAMLVALPCSFYTVVHWSLLHEWVHKWSIVLLSAAPLFFLSLLEEGLWWLPGGPKRRNDLRQLLCFGSLALTLAGFEGRVVFPAFGQYIQLHPPWNYVAVTVALYGSAALALVYLLGLLPEDTNSALASSALMASAALGSFAAGVPLAVMAAPLIGAGGLALFLESRQMRDYGLFVLGGALTTAWFLHHHFWFLDIWLQGLSVRQLCVMLWLAALFASLLPGLVVTKSPPKLVSAVLLIEALLLAILEEHLYLGADGIEGEMYPAVMVVSTSALGIAASERLRAQKILGAVTTWLLHCIFASKLAMLLLPQAKLPIPFFFLALAISAPVLLHKPPPGPSRLAKELPPWQGLLHTLAVVIATLHARYAIFEVLHLISGSRPSEGLLLGVLVLLGAGGCIPLVTQHYKQQRSSRRALVLVAAFGALLVVLRPPLPLQGGASCPNWLPSMLCYRLWDSAHTPEHELDDVAIWGEYGERRDRWPMWMLVGAAVAALSAATSQLPSKQRAAGALMYAIASGWSVGIYLALEFFPGQSALQVVVFIATQAVASVLVCLRLRGAVTPPLLGLLLAVWIAGLPIATIIQAVVPLPELPEDARRLFADAHILVEQQRQQANRAALQAVYSAEGLLLAFALKLQVSSALAAAAQPLPDPGSQAAAVLRMGNAYADQAASFLGLCLPPTLANSKRSNSIQGPMGGVLAQLSTEGLAWLPTAANLITLGTFGLSLVLNVGLTQGSEFAIFVLAPILLLLSQDPILWGLTPRRRYFPTALAISTYLAASSLFQAFSAWRSPESVTNPAAGSTLALIKNTWLAGASLPSHYYFNQYVWSRFQTPATTLLLAGPINVASMLFTDLAVIQILAATGLLMSCLQYVFMRHIRTEGLRLI